MENLQGFQGHTNLGLNLHSATYNCGSLIMWLNSWISAFFHVIAPALQGNVGFKWDIWKAHGISLYAAKYIDTQQMLVSFFVCVYSEGREELSRWVRTGGLFWNKGSVNNQTTKEQTQKERDKSVKWTKSTEKCYQWQIFTKHLLFIHLGSLPGNQCMGF